MRASGMLFKDYCDAFQAEKTELTSDQITLDAVEVSTVRECAP
jgi:hypothetical protein